MVTVPRIIGEPYTPDCMPIYILYPAKSGSVLAVHDKVALPVEAAASVKVTGNVFVVEPVAETVTVAL